MIPRARLNHPSGWKQNVLMGTRSCGVRDSLTHHTDCCLSVYWGGHHLQIAAFKLWIWSSWVLNATSDSCAAFFKISNSFLLLNSLLLKFCSCFLDLTKFIRKPWWRDLNQAKCLWIISTAIHTWTTRINAGYNRPIFSNSERIRRTNLRSICTLEFLFHV